MDGFITIATKVIDKTSEGLNKIKSKLESFDKEAEEDASVDVNIDTSNAENNLNNLSKKSKKIKSIWDNYEAPDFVDEISFDAQIELMEFKVEELRHMIQKPMNFNLGTEEVTKLSAEEEKLTNQIIKMREQQKKANEDVKKHGNSLEKIIKKVGKWVGAIIGIRSAYSAIRSAMSTLSQYDDSMASKVEYIQYQLANVLKPIIQWILNAILTLMSYINYLWKAWTKNNLFSSVKDFEKMKKASSDTAKNAKEIKKQLAGFDEMNILGDTSKAENDVGKFDFKLTPPEEIEPPKWLEIIKDFGQWIIDYWKEVLVLLGLTGIVLGGIKLGKFLKDLGLFNKESKDIKNTGSPFKGLFDGLGKGAEAIAILGGIALVIPTITDLIKTFSDSGMSLGDVAGLLGIVLGELAGAFVAIAVAMKFLEPSWQSIAMAVVIFGGFALVLHEVTELLTAVSDGGLELGDVAGILATVFGSLIIFITAMTVAAQFLQNPIALGGVAVLFLGLIETLRAMAETLPTILNAVGDFINNIAPSVIKIIEKINEGINNTIHALGDVLPPIIENIGKVFDTIFNGISNVIDTVGNTIINIMNTAKRLVQDVLSAILTFILKLGPAVNNFVDNMIVAITKLINFLVSGIEYMINTLVIGGINSMIKGINKLLPGDKFDLGTIKKVSIERFRPKLASGGILNMPGPGVYRDGAIVAEAGPEGQVPLTNDRSLEIIGETIAKHTKIDLTNIIKLNERTIAREIKRVNAESKFAYNG